MHTAKHSRLIDLVALMVVVSASVILVVYGNANASTIVIVGEFIAGILFAWFRLDGRKTRTDGSAVGASTEPLITEGGTHIGLSEDDTTGELTNPM
ncbi:hypothetical protein [Streptomyces chartreusis]|uniref:hypothetical protein n=1 Tax=Streptomyces chartreusis TaxID=1969 RepID=UPI0035E0310E